MSDPANSPASLASANRRALNRLLDEQGDRLYATLARLTLRSDVAADLFQELFLKLGRSDAFANAKDPTAYAFRSAINLAMEWRRKQRGTVATSSMTLATDVASNDALPVDRMILAEQWEQLLNALSELSESDQRLFVMRFIERQPYEVIARTAETTPHRVRGLCHAAVKRLRQKISGGVLPGPRNLSEENHVPSP